MFSPSHLSARQNLERRLRVDIGPARATIYSQEAWSGFLYNSLDTTKIDTSNLSPEG